MLKKVALFAAILLCFAQVNEVFAIDGVERADLKNARLVNSFGEAISQNINTNQQVQVAADITNKQISPQTFVYIVQILDKNGVALKLTWFSGSLNSQQTFSPAISWYTDTPGTYTAEIYVWDSIKNASALANPLKLNIIVS
ncbi:MAG: hypothetical protein LV468_02385 [Candidatus Nitrosotenuis sp.]|uniref:hypothetical protein n=1 Tax=Candidatus Nitrosotenuis cloacae TaxID=1603555 RepID=UPI0022811E1F|nr:hypothetical protein [Candidatus Nitrosotenuis cloacae]MDC8437832.1 hypothetical protein [Candidatus Nitrosotenuis sp.]